VFLLGLLLLSLVLVGLVQAGVLVYAYQRIGIGPAWLLGLLAVSMLGRAVNLPVPACLPRSSVPPGRDRVRRALPHPGSGGTVGHAGGGQLGGAVVPASLAGYLIAHNGLGWQALVAVTIISGLVHRLARLIPGLGIAVPALVPALIAASVGLLIAPAAAPALAYVAGVLGTLLGADIFNLRQVRALGAPIVSIGGARAPSTASTYRGDRRPHCQSVTAGSRWRRLVEPTAAGVVCWCDQAGEAMPIHRPAAHPHPLSGGPGRPSGWAEPAADRFGPGLREVLSPPSQVKVAIAVEHTDLVRVGTEGARRGALPHRSTRGSSASTAPQ